MKALNLILLVIGLSTVWAGVDGGGSIMDPILPKTKFEYNCRLNWISDLHITTAISQAQFKLNNENITLNASNLKWSHSYAHSLKPNQELSSQVGEGEALKNNIRPYNVSLTFEYDENSSNSEPKYKVTLSLAYGIFKSEESHTIITSSTTALLSDSNLNIEGHIYSNGKGESQLPVVFGLKCTK